MSAVTGTGRKVVAQPVVDDKVAVKAPSPDELRAWLRSLEGIVVGATEMLAAYDTHRLQDAFERRRIAVLAEDVAADLNGLRDLLEGPAPT